MSEFISNRERVGRGGVLLPEPLRPEAQNSRVDVLRFFRDFWNLNDKQIINHDKSLPFGIHEQPDFHAEIAVPPSPEDSEVCIVRSDFVNRVKEIDYWVPFSTQRKDASSKGFECHRLLTLPIGEAGEPVEVIRVEYEHVGGVSPQRVTTLRVGGEVIDNPDYASKEEYWASLADITQIFVDELSLE